MALTTEVSQKAFKGLFAVHPDEAQIEMLERCLKRELSTAKEKKEKWKTKNETVVQLNHFNKGFMNFVAENSLEWNGKECVIRFRTGFYGKKIANIVVYDPRIFSDAFVILFPEERDNQILASQFVEMVRTMYFEEGTAILNKSTNRVFATFLQRNNLDCRDKEVVISDSGCIQYAEKYGAALQNVYFKGDDLYRIRENCYGGFVEEKVRY